MALFKVNFLIINIIHVRVNLRDANVTTSIQFMGPSGKPIGDETLITEKIEIKTPGQPS